MSHEHDPASNEPAGPNALVLAVRAGTERFRDSAAAEQEGYHLMFGCISGGEFGAMGLHFVNGALIGDDVLDPTRPEIVIYEPMPDGRLRLVGADFLVFKEVWDAAHPAPPQLMGQLLHLFDAPNRFGFPAFYALHVWAWKENPNGTFVNWHPHVSCDAFGDSSSVPPDPGPDGLTRFLSKGGHRESTEAGSRTQRQQASSKTGREISRDSGPSLAPAEALTPSGRSACGTSSTPERSRPR